MAFDSPDVNLGMLLRDVASGVVQLPDFQREWKWDDDRIASLIASIASDHPVGVVMMLEVGGEGVRFAPKPIAGVDPTAVGAPEKLLLDGQQRLTSLFQALVSDQPADTTDARGKRLRRWYYLDIAKTLDPGADREEAIVSVPEDKIIREDFGRSVVADYTTIENECRAEMFPLSNVFNPGSIFSWQNAYLALDHEGSADRSTRWIRFYQDVLENVIQYVVPVIVLKKNTPKEAVCTVFEKVNTGGVPLNVFELLTATFASDDFRLNDDWKARKERFDQLPALQSIESTDFLQAISLLATRAKRLAHSRTSADGSQAPGVSCKRKDILRLTLPEYQTWADLVTDAFEWTARFLAQEHIFRASDVPYRTQVVPLAAIKTVLGESADQHAAYACLQQWYWCGVLGELYGGSIETRFARDLEQVPGWVAGGPTPNTVNDANFHEARFLTLRTRNSAAYKGIYALLMRNDCLDWIRREPMNLATFFNFQVDIHHIFPKAWCDKNGIEHSRRESIVNKTAISASTNRSIGGRSPADYLPTLEQHAGLSPSEMDRVISTHAIEARFLRDADFDLFFAARSSALLERISEAMGKEATRSDPGDLDPSLVDFEEEPDDPDVATAVEELLEL